MAQGNHKGPVRGGQSRAMVPMDAEVGASECGQPVETGKGNEIDSPRGPPERMQPC